MKISKKYQRIAQEISSFDFSSIGDHQLLDHVGRLKAEINGGTPLDSVIPQFFAIVREVFDRRLGIWKLFDLPASELPSDEIIQKNHQFVSEKRTDTDDAFIHLDASFYEAVRRLRKSADKLTFMPYDVQLISALALYEGKITEVGTGEGKTIVAVFPACLWALCGKKVHIATVNDYLALRDCTWMSPVIRFLGLNVDCVLSTMSDSERRTAYSADIVYGNNYEFGFDYLRDNMKIKPSERVQGKLEYVIIDEIDSILMDEATTPLIISGTPEGYSGNYWKFKPTVELLMEKQDKLVQRLLDELNGEDDRRIKTIKLIQIAKADPWNDRLLDYLSSNRNASREMLTLQGRYASARSEHKLEAELFYVVDEKNRAVKLTERGMELIEQKHGEDFLTISPDAPESGEIRNFLQLLRAYILYRKDEDYVVYNGGVIIVDEFTGRLAFGKKYEEGLHQAIECKEGLQITPENRVMGKVTQPNYFKLYKKMTGMTATAHTEADEFRKLYKLEIARIPTNKPVIRADLPDRFYKTESEKLEAIANAVEECYKLGRPVLVGTRSVEKSESLSKLLTQRKIPHNVLNAKNHAQEAEIIKSAGQPHAVTIATNMAGRGTDIALRDDLHQIVTDNYIERVMRKSGNGNEGIRINVYSDFEFEMLFQRLQKRTGKIQVDKNGKAIILGDAENVQSDLDFNLGLYVIGTERHSARRIDDQLIGRSGRQGDPGSSRFFLSLQDDLFRIFGSEEMSAMVRAFNRKRNGELRRLTRLAQRRSEEMAYSTRKHLIERDNVMDKQRKIIYRMRWNILSDDRSENLFRLLIADYISDLIESDRYINAERSVDNWDIDGLKRHCLENFGVHIPDLTRLEADIEAIKQAMIGSFQEAYAIRERAWGNDFSRRLERVIMIDTLDTAWTDYLSFQNEFDISSFFGSYFKENAMTDYKLKFAGLFKDMLTSVRREALISIFSYPLPDEKIDSLRRADKAKQISPQVSELLE